MTLRPALLDRAEAPPGTEGAPPALSIVIPVYHEGRNIALTLQALEDAVPVPYEALIVYDDEADTTVPVVRGLQARHPQAVLVRNAIAAGPSGALRTGFQRARAEQVLVVMADLCDDVSQIPQMLELATAGADVVCPSRYCRGGSQELRATFKVWLPRWAGRGLRWLTGLPTYDPTNSFKLYSARMLRRLALRSTVSFSVTLEIVAKAHCLGYRIAEIPTVWRDRQHGQSHFKLWPSLAVYLPWFGAALLRNRVFRLPDRWLRAWFAAPSADPQAVAHG